MTISELFHYPNRVYDGDLRPYFPIVFNAPNNDLPYHNYRHTLHVALLCYDACLYYREDGLGDFKERNLIIAALFHDYNHTGGAGPDSVNIGRAIAGLDVYILEIDRPSFEEISLLIQATEYPHEGGAHTSLAVQILQDADLAQSLDRAWVQQTVRGLAKEKGSKPIEMLRKTIVFFGSLKFQTEWAKEKFPQSLIDQRRAEAEYMLSRLQPTT